MLVDIVVFMEVNCPGFLGLQTAVKSLCGSVRPAAWKEVHLHISLQSACRYHQPIVRPDGCVPLPLLSDPWVGLVNDLAKLGYHLTRLVLEVPQFVCRQASKNLETAFLVLTLF